MQSSDSSALPRQLRLLGFLPWPGTALAIAGETRSPRFRCAPFVRDVAIDPGRASAPRVAVPHILPSTMCTANRKRHGLGKPETFNFLGFTVFCGKSRRGTFLVHRKTRRDRMTAKLKEVKGQLRRQMHRPIPEQGNWLKQVVIGFFAYHAVPTNFRALLEFRAQIKGLWLRTLRRRSQKDQTNWERITKFADDFLPQPRILHPWHNQRFAVTHPRWAPYA